MEGIKRMRYTPVEKMNVLVSKIETHLKEIKVTIDKLFPKEKVTKKIIKPKSKK